MFFSNAIMEDPFLVGSVESPLLNMLQRGWGLVPCVNGEKLLAEETAFGSA